MDYEKLKAQLKVDEGERLKPYKDTKGIMTIGVGHNMESGPLPPLIALHLKDHGCITEEMQDELLDADIEEAQNSADKLYPDLVLFSDARQRALVNFVFNVGMGTAKKFRNTNAAINSGDWESAAQGFENSLWYRQVGDRAKRIVKLIREG